MGSASLYHLARRGAQVLGCDQYSPPHQLGSSHGRSRIIREAYFEHPLYVPLVRRAFESWKDLEQDSGQLIYRQTGGLMLGRPDGPLVSGSLDSAITHGIDHEVLAPEEVRRRFPGFTPPEDFVGVWEERAGILRPEVAIEAHLRGALRAGGTILRETEVLTWEAGEGGVRVETRGGTIHAGTLVLAAGPWIGSLLPGRRWFTVERQVFHWFASPQDASRWPVALWEHRLGGLFVTLPEAGHRLKADIHHEGEVVSPDTVDREPSPADLGKIRALLGRHQPGGNGRLLEASVCLYTNSADGHFIFDWHPEHRNVLIVSPCSGHGFKFASVIGEIVADLVITGRAAFDLSPFSAGRFR